MAKKSGVADIVVERLIEKIQSEKVLPWNKPFQSACMNWFSNREYMGVNKILLNGGEYITPNQLETYNKKNGTTFWFESGTPWEIVVFYTKLEKKISDAEAQQILKQASGYRIVKPTENGWVKITWLLRYYRVYNINFIRQIKSEELKNNPEYKDGVFEKVKNEKTNKYRLKVVGYNPVLKPEVSEKDIEFLTPKLGTSIIEEHTPADHIVDHYTNNTGVRVVYGSGGAYYTHLGDYVSLPPKPNFKSTEAYYRVLFHELIHSTGITERLNRSCFHDYHQGSKERSKEELIAEVGGLLLASEAGFREDTEWADNSIDYVAGWCSWMKDNPNEVLNGMLAAEKAKNFILSGGVKSSENMDRSIDNPDEGSSDADGLVDSLEGEVEEKVTPSPSPASTTTSEDRPEVKTLKSKKAVKEYFHKFLFGYFDVSSSSEEKTEILASIKANELGYLYYVLTKEKLPAGKKKSQLLTMIKNIVEGETRIG